MCIILLLLLIKQMKKRRTTRVVNIGCVGIGGNNEIRVQTMANTDTLDIKKTVNQCIECIEQKSELIRITTPTLKHLEAFKKIKATLVKNGYKTPLIADIHFSPDIAYKAIEYADKIRINPGNLFDDQFENTKIWSNEEYNNQLEKIENNLTPFIGKLKKYNIAIRIGTNHGSLSKRILSKYGDTTKGMVESTLEYLRIFKNHGFNNIIVSIKASDPILMIDSNRLLVKEMDKLGMDYPIHLGVTEAGNLSEGRIKSAIGIGTLLLEGIGDTIRVSLTEAPINELKECYNILQTCGKRITKTEFISCPGCGRTLFDIEKVTYKIKSKLSHLKGIKIGIMGCIVNGIGELSDTDFGYVGGSPGKITLFKGKEIVERGIPADKAVSKLIELIKKEGKWK